MIKILTHTKKLTAILWLCIANLLLLSYGISNQFKSLSNQNKGLKNQHTLIEKQEKLDRKIPNNLNTHDITPQEQKLVDSTVKAYFEN